MAKLFLFFVALVLGSASAARHSPAPAEQEGAVAPAGGSHVEPGAQFQQIKIGDDGAVNCPDTPAKDCMHACLQAARNIGVCNGGCNILIYFARGSFKTSSIDIPYYMEVFWIGDTPYRLYIFHGKGYLETDGWYGWENWAFSGNFSHTPETGIVQFYPYGQSLW